MIYHLSDQSAWTAAQSTGTYLHPSLQTEGFIHCCRADQLAGVVERYFQGATDLMLLTIDPTRLTSQLVEEFSPPGQDVFPHLYGPLNMDAVVEAQPYPLPTPDEPTLLPPA